MKKTKKNYMREFKKDKLRVVAGSKVDEGAPFVIWSKRYKVTAGEYGNKKIAKANLKVLKEETRAGYYDEDFY